MRTVVQLELGAADPRGQQDPGELLEQPGLLEQMSNSLGQRRCMYKMKSFTI